MVGAIILKKIECEEFFAEESIIDTNYFGVSVAKTILKKPCTTKDKQDRLLDFINNFSFNVIINKTNNSANNLWIGERTNAFLLDVNVQFKKKAHFSDKIGLEQIYVFDCLHYDNQIVTIAENEFLISRFQNDPYLPKEKAKNIYKDIVINAFEKKNRYFVISKNNSVTTGFILFSLDNINSTSRIDLIGVSKSFQGIGLGKLLIKAFENYSYYNDVKDIYIGTQIDNFHAVKAYLSYGFKIFECNTIFHYWPLKNRNIE